MFKAIPCSNPGLIFGAFWLFLPLVQAQSWTDLKTRGFPQAQVVAMEQDKFGFMWFSTSQGLIRWDGEHSKWIRHDPKEPSSLSSGNGRTLSASEDHLWAGFHGGLSQIDVSSGQIQRFSKFGEQESVNVWSIYHVDQPNTWVGTDQALFRWDGNEFEIQNIPRDGIPCMAWVSGKLWVGTDEQGLWVHDGSWHMVDGSKGIKFRAMLVQDQTIWIGTAGKGLWQLDTENKTWRTFLINENDSTNQVNTLARDHKDHLWIGTALGLFTMKMNEPGTFNSDPNFESEHVRFLYSEPSGLIFCATEKPGVWQLDLLQERFHNLPLEKGGAWSHLVQDELIIVGGKSGLSTVNTTNGRNQSYLENQTIRDLVPDGDQFWIATDSGLYAGKETFEKKIGDVRIWSIESREALLWLGSDKGLIQFDKKNSIEYIDTNNGLSYNITTSVRSNDGSVWAGTYGGGLNQIDPETLNITVYKNDPENPNSLSANDVVSLFVDRDQQLWVCTLSGGLNRFSETGFKRFGIEQGLPDQTTVGMTQDDEGRYWVYSASGLTFFDPINQTIKTFTHDHGLLTGSALPSGISYQNNRLFIGGTNGLAWADSKALMKDDTPNAVITYFQSDDSTWMADNPSLLTFDKPQKSMVVEMALIDFRPRNQGHTSYQREAIDSEFIQGHSASYTQYLPFGGSGTLHFKFRDTYNQILQKQLNIKVEKPSWVRWAPLWGTVLFLLMVATIYQWSALAFRKKQAKLEAIANFERDRAEVAEKRTELEIREREMQQDTQRILQDFMEQRLNELANEIHDGPLGKITGLGFQLSELSKVPDAKQWQKKVMALTENDIPNICKDLRSTCQSLLSPDLSDDFCEGLEDLVEQSLENSDTQVEFDWGADLQHISLETKKGLYRIVRTLAQNVARHAQATKLRIKTKANQESFRFEFKDDGKGFQLPENLETLKQDGHFGLYLCAAFAKSMGANLSFESEPGSGFSANIEIPITVQEKT